jgi:hypothetical protein
MASLPRATALWHSLSPLFQLHVEMSERSELAGEFGIARSLRLATGRKIAAPEKVGGRYNRGTHGSVFIGALRPREIAVYPKIKAHKLRCNTMRKAIDSLQQLIVAKWLAQYAAVGELRCQMEIRRGGEIEQMNLSGRVQKSVRLVGDHYVRHDAALAQQLTGVKGFSGNHPVAVPLQHGAQKAADEGIFRDQDRVPFC